MRDIVLIFMAALGAALVVGLLGMLAVRLLRTRSIMTHILVLLAVTVAAVVAGVVVVAKAMFLNQHDRDVVLVTVAAAGVVSLAAGWLFGRRLAAAAVWADQARERERRLEASRRNLVAWVSHDLRTPLAGLRAMAEALEDRVVHDADTVAEYHRRIRAEVDRLARLVDDLFELSRINASALRLSLSRVPLGEVVSDALASAAPVAAARGVRLVAAESGWPTVTASEPELGRIVANLIRNAVRYTPEDGTVTVSGGRDRDSAWLAVTDTCGGIPDTDLPHVFDVAFRGERSRTPRHAAANRSARTGSRLAGATSNGTWSDGAGTDSVELDGAAGGLGLAIVHGLVQAHGGRVDVRNVPNGCRFTVHLPAAG